MNTLEIPFGNGRDTSFVLYHGLGKPHPLAQVYRQDDHCQVEAVIHAIDADHVKVSGFVRPPDKESMVLVVG